MLRVEHGAGTSIKLELWALSAAAFGKFVAAIPPPLSIGTIRLADGRGVKGFLVEPAAVERRARHFVVRRLAGVHGAEGGGVAGGRMANSESDSEGSRFAIRHSDSHAYTDTA